MYARPVMDLAFSGPGAKTIMGHPDKTSDITNYIKK